MRVGLEPGRWVVFRYGLERDWSTAGLEVPEHVLAAVDGLEARGRREQQPFLISPSGLPDLRVNDFFMSRRMRSRSPLTWRKYAYSIGLWLNFLLALGREWHEATYEDAEYFKEWRISDGRNPSPVEPTTFRGDLAALRSFYRWAAVEHQAVDPVVMMDDYDLMPRGTRMKDVKWLDPAGYDRWRDLGLRGRHVDGREDRGWRGRNEQRDVAFADGLYGGGLRLTEWASLLTCELPDEDGPKRKFLTCWLADACAKQQNGHKYWLPRAALLQVLDYVEGARARAVRRAQQEGRYEHVERLRLVLEIQRDRLRIREPGGWESRPSVNAVSPSARRRLFTRTEQGLEPLAVWLNEDGLPRAKDAWEHTFTRANQRLDRLGLAGFRATPHMLRHSFALKWYSVGKLLYEARVGHLVLPAGLFGDRSA